MRAAFGVAHLLGGVDLHLEVAALEQLDLELHRFAAARDASVVVGAKGYVCATAAAPWGQRALSTLWLSTLLLRGSGFVLRLPPYTHRSTLSSVLQFDR